MAGSVSPSDAIDRAFVEFYNQTKTRVFGFVFVRCGSAELAEEVIRDDLASLDPASRS